MKNRMYRWADGRCSNPHVHIIQETKRVINGDHDFVNSVRRCVSWWITVSSWWLHRFYRASNFPALPKDLEKVLTRNDFTHLASQGLWAPFINWLVPSDDRKCLFQGFQSKMLIFTTIIFTNIVCDLLAKNPAEKAAHLKVFLQRSTEWQRWVRSYIRNFMSAFSECGGSRLSI